MQAYEGTFATLIQKVRAYINVGATDVAVVLHFAIFDEC